MKILLSPAKTLDFESMVPTTRFGEPVFLAEANAINRVLLNKTPKQLMALMNISDKLSELNWHRNQEWEKTQYFRQAVYAFKGEVYVGLNAYDISESHFDYLQNTLRILSGQYGLLKPFDQIKPYRLEMGTPLKMGNSKNLYEFWDHKITEVLNQELEKEEVVVNLASNEYFKVIQPKILKAKIITPIFKDFKNNEYKVISFFAKKARGLMTRFAIENEIFEVEKLKTFEAERYAYDDKLSTEFEWVFTR